MKFTPEVLAALAVLREHADNDFERHRIDVLERDLTAPPVVEVIDGEHQRFDGVIYNKNKKTNRYCRSGEIHRAVWAYCYGKIPDGYQIHHIDENPAINACQSM